LVDDGKDTRFDKGLARRKEVLGAQYVERSLGNVTPFDEDFQRFITEGVWGSVWTRPGLTTRERSMLVIGLLAALGHHGELALHIRATRNTGATPDDIKEVMMMVANYAGIPAGNAAIAVAKQTYAEMAEQDK
jgi:4-carboxymuconolactone decarboxylase